MKLSLLLSALLATAAFGLAQNPPMAPAGASETPLQRPSMGRIGATSVWQIPPTFLASVHKACDNAPPPSFADCFINQMSKAGASPAAVAFTRMLFKQSGGDVGVMSGFNKVGPVDVAFVVYPLRANTNNGILFVNGTPRIVNAENLQLLDQATMQQSPQFQNTKAQFPKVTVWPGDRDGTTWPNSSSNPDGSVSFTLGYPLLNGCHACERVGSAEFNWKFGPTGKFLGTTFMGMTPPPVQ
ncbi:MAG TPA: hypothetical protein VIH91_02530 [Terriglobales bacterium]